MQVIGSQVAEKLTEEDYLTWKIQIKTVLILYNELWNYVNGNKKGLR